MTPCGNEGGMGNMTNACTKDVTALISMNHNHTLTVPLADITAGVDKTYSAKGTADHDHFIKVTAADFTALKAGTVVKKKSCNADDHEIWLSCTLPSTLPAAPACTDECGAAEAMVCQ